MGVETERKFLVKSDAWRADADAGTVMAQGYLADTERAVVRVRVAGSRGFLTVKGRNTGISRAEYEYPIPAADALQMLETLSCGGIVRKTRFRVASGAGLTWEIDVFEGENAGLVTAEIELPDEKTVFEKPAWLGAEVSGDARYYNSNLAKSPYRTWSVREDASS